MIDRLIHSSLDAQAGNGDMTRSEGLPSKAEEKGKYGRGFLKEGFFSLTVFLIFYTKFSNTESKIMSRKECR